MKNKDLKIVIVASTNGSVMNKLFQNTFFKKCIYSVVSDRQCGALEVAKNNGIAFKLFNERDKEVFCDKLLVYLIENQIDYVISFFTKLFVGNIIDVYKDRIINLHPAILPSFKGLDGFGDSVRYGSRFIGSTIHFIDKNMDEGKIIIQTASPLNLNKDISYNRNIIFQHQCKSLLQVAKWLYDERIYVKDDKVIIKDGAFDEFEFSPNLDFVEAKDLFKDNNKDVTIYNV
ncbi:MAG: formyltransferase family protein [Bacillota bacterium]|nr:formyltransferase family protein [Bacillota bacterium]